MPETLNLHSYCYNNPVNRVDRLGLQSTPALDIQRGITPDPDYGFTIGPITVPGDPSSPSPQEITFGGFTWELGSSGEGSSSSTLPSYDPHKPEGGFEGPQQSSIHQENEAVQQIRGVETPKEKSNWSGFSEVYKEITGGLAGVLTFLGIPALIRTAARIGEVQMLVGPGHYGPVIPGALTVGSAFLIAPVKASFGIAASGAAGLLGGFLLNELLWEPLIWRVAMPIYDYGLENWWQNFSWRNWIKIQGISEYIWW